MRVYFIVYILTLFLNYLIPVHNRSDYLRKLIIVFVPLFLFGAFREHFSDQDTYEGYFEEGQLLSSFVFDPDAHSEIGYQWLCYIMPSFRALLVFTSFLMCAAYIVLFYHNVPPKALISGITLLFLSGNLSIYFVLSSMRNGIAMSLFVLCFSFWQDRKVIPFLIVTFIASTMHTSAWFSLPLAFMVGRSSPFEKKELYIWIGALVFFSVSSSLFLIDAVTPYINAYFSRYDSVVELAQETGNTFHWLGTFGSALLFSLLVPFLFKTKELTKRETSLLRVALLFPFALVMTSLNARMSQYYSPFIVAATSLIYVRFPKSMLRTTYLVMTYAYLGYFFYLWSISRWDYYGVYHSVLGSF